METATFRLRPEESVLNNLRLNRSIYSMARKYSTSIHGMDFEDIVQEMKERVVVLETRTLEFKSKGKEITPQYAHRMIENWAKNKVTRQRVINTLSLDTPYGETVSMKQGIEKIEYASETEELLHKEMCDRASDHGRVRFRDNSQKIPTKQAIKLLRGLYVRERGVYDGKTDRIIREVPRIEQKHLPARRHLGSDEGSRGYEHHDNGTWADECVCGDNRSTLGILQGGEIGFSPHVDSECAEKHETVTETRSSEGRRIMADLILDLDDLDIEEPVKKETFSNDIDLDDLDIVDAPVVNVEKVEKIEKPAKKVKAVKEVPVVEPRGEKTPEEKTKPVTKRAKIGRPATETKSETLSVPLYNDESDFEVIRMDSIIRNMAYQPRSRPSEGIDEMAEDIKARGQITPIQVLRQGDNNLLLSGWRRHAAIDKLQSETINAQVIKSNLTEDQIRAIALGSNLFRVDLTTWEKAKDCFTLFNENGKLDLERIYGVKKSTISLWISIYKAAQEDGQLTTALDSNDITLAHAAIVVRARDEGMDLLPMLIEGDERMSVKTLEAYREKMRKANEPVDVQEQVSADVGEMEEVADAGQILTNPDLDFDIEDLTPVKDVSAKKITYEQKIIDMHQVIKFAREKLDEMLEDIQKADFMELNRNMVPLLVAFEKMKEKFN